MALSVLAFLFLAVVGIAALLILGLVVLLIYAFWKARRTDKLARIALDTSHREGAI